MLNIPMQISRRKQPLKNFMKMIEALKEEMKNSLKEMEEGLERWLNG